MSATESNKASLINSPSENALLLGDFVRKLGLQLREQLIRLVRVRFIGQIPVFVLMFGHAVVIQIEIF